MERAYPMTTEERLCAEAVLLGSLFLQPEAGKDVKDLVQPEDFLEERHRLIYEALLTVLSTPDIVTVGVVSSLLLQEELERLGGVAYLTTLKQQAKTTTMSIEEQAHLLKQATLHRMLSQVGEMLHTRTKPYDHEDMKHVIGDFERTLRVAHKLYPSADVLPPSISPFHAELDDYLSDLGTRRRQQTAHTGIPTGFVDLDMITGGLQQADLMIIAGPPSSGKTSFALSIALHVLLKEHRSVGLFSLEAPKRQVIRRLLAMETGLNQWQLGSLKLDDDEWSKLGEASATLSEAKLWIDDTANLSTTQLSSKAHLLVKKYGVELLIVDYVHLMLSSVNDKRHENRVQEMGEISRSLKVLARHLNIPVLGLAHVSRAFESRPSKQFQLTDLRDGTLENDADLVLFLSLAEADVAGAMDYQLATISIAKHRNGPCTNLHVCFHPGSTRFRDLQTVTCPSVSMQSSVPPPVSSQPPMMRRERLQDIMARASAKRQTKQEPPKPSSPPRGLPLGDVFREGETDGENEPDATSHHM